MSASRPASPETLESTVSYQTLEPVLSSSAKKKQTAAQSKASALLSQLHASDAPAAAFDSSSSSSATNNNTAQPGLDLLTGNATPPVSATKSSRKKQAVSAPQFIELQASSSKKKKQQQEEKAYNQAFFSSASSHSQLLLGDDHFGEIDQQRHQVPYRQEDETVKPDAFCGCFNFFGKSKAKAAAKKIAKEQKSDHGDYVPPTMGLHGSVDF
ncbi:MAG: hypothetical protein P4M14_05280 [Gammaproteobacteria bacterium]|nr:hypothetical protein [Gammaproteobacteria bacterium]